MSNNKAVRLTASEQIPTIMEELQTAANTLKEMGAGISVFGSARIKPGTPYYEIAQEVGRRLAEAGLTLIAGGGPGLMEAANKGAFEAHGQSIGLNIRLPHETSNNPYQTQSLQFEYFCSRKATFFMHSAAYIALPGGFGTLDELFEVLTLVQTRKIPPAPIVLIGTKFWSGLINWIRDQLQTQGLIGPHDLDLLILTDDLDIVMHHIHECCVIPSSEPVLPQ
ncbi:TIGR00730 family Rossman fold protein [Alcaligenes endophyticus]|uniref:Cytokinin riboside 5'-monophosphate phosphoribohydrolase n=1 Tax=Alcaligenes endophyticus TaxID=1929088 RepID=A0ABT8EN94_9BURK|nr:TIGR00730 family Rossman fold protein [Alcaligenes endophyticus]MCX5591343.1 TIGR00730 family Rossman fold protein [Alcaligenes endophyticus]MDN4122776.1 TIGR00730 family Rossman fold protein [Alcaligenes endophyticus]